MNHDQAICVDSDEDEDDSDEDEDDSSVNPDPVTPSLPPVVFYTSNELSPDYTDLATIFRRVVDNSKHGIIACSYSFTHQGLTHMVLYKKQQMGDDFKLTIMVDANFWNNLSQNNRGRNVIVPYRFEKIITLMIEKGVDFRISTGVNGMGIMHNKFLIYGDSTLYHTSANMTRNGYEFSWESMFLISDQPTIDKVITDF